MIECLLLDLDDTILDFRRQEHEAIEKTLRSFGLEPDEVVLERYSRINQDHWQRLERKELTREQVLVGRFETLFREYGMEIDPVCCARTYENNLSMGHYFLPGAREAVERLSKKYKLYLASNGTAHVQAGRLKSADISHFFQDIFISQSMGANKPDLLYFERCFARMPGFTPQTTLMVGDSLSSDILGAKQAGIPACWVNPQGKPHPEHLCPDYEIQSLSQLEALLETISL